MVVRIQMTRIVQIATASLMDGVGMDITPLSKEGFVHYVERNLLHLVL
jgi:hypothetical protein